MGVGPLIVIMKKLKAHVFNAKGKRNTVWVLEESPLQLFR
jgi:hypothetical protein